MSDSARGSFSQLHAGELAACGVQPDMLLAGFLAGFRVEFSEFCAILMTDSLSLLVSLVYLNLVRIRLLQYLSTEEILP